jgi:glycosyltransferase involved in cell wall biosynthesis
MSLSPVKIALFSKGRSHLWDLFMAMEQCGADVTFYSDLPKVRLRKFGLKAQVVHSFFSDCFLFYAFQRLRLMPSLNGAIDYRFICKLDNTVSKRLDPCDLLIGLSGLTLATIKAAKANYKAQVWLERGSVHILEQKKILDEIANIPRTSLVPEWAIERELEGYDLADKIVVPSSHVAKTFYQHGINAKKLFVNSYGVNLEDFPVTQMPQGQRPTILFVGGWTYQKGCDLLNQLIVKASEIDLIHVGSPGDCPFPNSPNFTSVGHVSQRELSQYYGAAHLLIHASRQDGMSLVLAQALASGLPIVATPMTGAIDLISKIAAPEAIKIVSEPTVDNLILAVRSQLKLFRSTERRKAILGDCRDSLSWMDSAKTYLTEIESCLNLLKYPSVNK